MNEYYSNFGGRSPFSMPTLLAMNEAQLLNRINRLGRVRHGDQLGEIKRDEDIEVTDPVVFCDRSEVIGKFLAI